MRLFSLIWWGYITLAIGVYSLPWVINPGTSLTLNGYDLAEWSSLHPAVRAAGPTPLTAFALRSPLLWISILIAFGPHLTVWLQIATILAIAGVLLPPPEFFTSNFDDPNYRQMLFLAGAAVIAGVAGIVYHGQRWRIVIQGIAAAAIIAVSLSGLVTGFILIRDFNLQVEIGPGGPGLIILSIAFGIGLIIKRGNFLQVTS